MNDSPSIKRASPRSHNEASSSFTNVKEDIEALIKRVEKRLSEVEAKLNSSELTSRERRHYMDAFTKLAGTLRSLYALKLGKLQPEEEESEDLAKLLSGLEKEAKLHIKGQPGRKRGKQQVKAEEAGVQLVLAVIEAISMCHTILSDRRYAIAVRIECARLLPSLIQAVQALAGQKPVPEAMLS